MNAASELAVPLRPATWRNSALPLYLLLATDVVNGLWALATPEGLGSAAFAIKAVLASYLVLRLRWNTGSLVSIALALICLGWLVLAYGTSKDATSLALKTVSVICILALLRRYAVKLSPRSLRYFLMTALAVIFSSLMLGLMGFGHDRYGDSEGKGLQANGFLVSGNEINIALVGLFWWLAASRARNRGITTYSILYWACLFCMFLSQSKTTIVSALIIMFYFHRVTVVSVIALAAAVPAALYLFVTSAIWARWSYFYGMYADQGVLTAITNGRFGRIEEFYTNAGDLLLVGASVLASTGGYIESDPLDLLFNFGTTGLLLYLLFAWQVRQISRPTLLPFLLVMATTVFAGHVVYSAFAAPILFCSLHAVREASVSPPHPTGQQPATQLHTQ